MRIPIGIWLASVISLGSMILHAQEDLSLRNEIEKIIRYDTEILDGRTAGFIVGVVDHDSISISIFGSMVQDSMVEMNDQTIFEIGGLTKVFLAHLSYILQSEGLINIQNSINDYLPSKYRNASLNFLTVEHLITHTSGFPTMPSNLGEHQKNISNPYADYSNDQLLRFYQNFKQSKSRNKYIYSHINYALLEIVLENSTKESLHALLSKYVFNPAGMTKTFIECDSCTIAPGYDRSHRLTDPWRFAAFAGSEGLKSTAKDLCNYMRSQFTKSANSLFSKLLVPSQKIHPSKKSYIAKGWHLFRNKRGPEVYLHSGKTAGHAASIHFVDDTKTAVILLTNTVTEMDGLATLVLRLINNNWRRK